MSGFIGLYFIPLSPFSFPLFLSFLYFLCLSLLCLRPLGVLLQFFSSFRPWRALDRESDLSSFFLDRVLVRQPVMTPPIGIVLSYCYLTLAVLYLRSSVSLPSMFILGLSVLLLLSCYVLIVTFAGPHLSALLNAVWMLFVLLSSYGYLLPPNG